MYSDYIIYIYIIYIYIYMWLSTAAYRYWKDSKVRRLLQGR